MINYELALRLKQAGFPQYIPTHSPNERYSADGKSVHQWQHHTGNPLEEFNDENAIKIPTLSELIEACGQPLALVWRTNKCRAWQKGKKDSVSGHGDTPEEAVAKLWLALQEDKK